MPPPENGLLAAALSTEQLFVDVRHAGDAGGPGTTFGRVVFVHGAMDRSTSFGKVRSRLRSLETVAYDRRGYAQSCAVLPAATSFADHLDDLVGVVDGRPSVVVGHSYGADVALALAATRPDLVSAVVAFEPPMSWTTWWPDGRAGGGTLKIGAEKGPAEAAESFMRRIVGDSVWERLGAATRLARRAEGQALLIDLGGLRTSSVAPFFAAAIRCPVVVGHGTRSAPHQRRSAHETVLSLCGSPRVELAAIAEAGHGAHVSHADEFAALVLRALELAETTQNGHFRS